jgi:hypothetical protein
MTLLAEGCLLNFSNPGGLTGAIPQTADFFQNFIVNAWPYNYPSLSYPMLEMRYSANLLLTVYKMMN